MYPSSLALEIVIEEITAMPEETKLLKGSSQQDNTVVSTAMLLRSEIKEFKETIFWPPTESDSISKVTVGMFLNFRLQTLLSGKVSNTVSHKILCRPLSYAQDLIHGVTN